MEQIHVRIWNMTEILPKTDQSKAKKATARLMSISLVLLGVSLLFNLFVNDNVSKEIVSMHIVSVLMMSLKYVLFRSQRQRLTTVLRIVFQIESMTSKTNQYEQSLLENCSKTMRFLAAANSGLCTFALGMLGVTMVISTNRQLLYPSYLPPAIDWRNNNIVYGICICWQLITIAYAILLYVTLDLFGPNLFIVLNVFMQILERRLHQIGWKLQGKFSTDQSSLQSQLISAVRFHELCLV